MSAPVPPSCGVVDVGDDAALAAWHEVLVRAERHGREATATPWPLPEMVERLRAPGAGQRYEAWALLEDGAVRAAALLEWRTADNLDRADLRVMTDPARRGRGHGSALLEALLDRARALGRTRVGADAWWPVEAGPDGAGQPSVAWLTARGFRLGVSEVLRVVDLPVPPDALDALAAEAAAVHGPAGYRVLAFAGAVPDELAADWARLAGALEAEAPTGDIELEAADGGVAGLRQDEDLLRRQGRTPYRAVALDRTGAVAAYTELMTTRHEPERAYQWGTLVRAADRGHRLGLAVKVAALRLLQEEAPGVRRVFTWNAEANTWMVAVNERLGYRAVERAGLFERRLDAPSA